jgi:hypothetical protein
MRLEWILHPVMTYAEIAIGLFLCSYLFISLKRDLHASEARLGKKLAALGTDCQVKMESLDERWAELSQVSSLLVPPPPPRSGLNLSKRSQALQMHRRGESAPEIAAALAIPQNEVELLVKVQTMALSGLEKPAAASYKRAAAGL